MEITTIDPFLKYFSNIRDRTLRVARCARPDQINWSPTPGKFTFADILRHIAVTERYMFAENVQNKPSRYTTHGPELAATPDEIFALLDRLHAESTQMFAGLTDADLQAKCTTPGGAAITTWKWLRSMTEHEIHHRGQLYIYLGILGVPTPPLYGLTSEEVRSRSHHPERANS